MLLLATLNLVFKRPPIFGLKLAGEATWVWIQSWSTQKMAHCSNAGHVIEASPSFTSFSHPNMIHKCHPKNLRHLGQSPPPELNVQDLCPSVNARTCDNSGSNNSEAALIHSRPQWRLYRICFLILGQLQTFSIKIRHEPPHRSGEA